PARDLARAREVHVRGAVADSGRESGIATSRFGRTRTVGGEHVAVDVVEDACLDLWNGLERGERLARGDAIAELERNPAVERDHTAQRVQVALRRPPVVGDLRHHEEAGGQCERAADRDGERLEQALLDRARGQPTALAVAGHFTSDAIRKSFELITRSPRTDLRRLMLKLTRPATSSMPTSPPSFGKSKRSATVRTSSP